LKTERDASAVAGAAWGASYVGAAAKPLLPALRTAATSVDNSIARIFEQAINNIEKAKEEPVPEAEAKRRAMIRKDIREFVSSAKGKARE